MRVVHPVYSAPLATALLLAGEREISAGFDWVKSQGENDAAALYHPDSLAMFAAHGLEAMVRQPGDTDFLKSVPATLLNGGDYGSIYELDGTGLVVKKHFPEVYIDGYEGRGLTGKNYMRTVSGNSILSDLVVNLRLERALQPEPDYTTPQYLGHLTLKDSADRLRHYTIMTKLDAATAITSEEAERIAALTREAKVRCLQAMCRARQSTKFINWDIVHDRGAHNIIPTRPKQAVVLGIIDQGNIFSKGKRLHGDDVPLQSRRTHDPDAPWLPVVKDRSYSL